MSRRLSIFPFRFLAAITVFSLFVSGFAVGGGRPVHALGLFAGPGIQPLAANSNSFHYYASGKRIDLTPSVNWVSVKFADANPSAQTDALKSAGAPLSATGKTRATPSKGWTLVPVAPGTTQAALVQGINAMRGMPAKFTEVNPVFQAGNDEMAVTDEFIATFDPAESQAQIDATNASYGVEVVQPLLGQSNMFVLRVSPASHMDALAMSNLYQDSGAALTAAPNFLRMTPITNTTASAPTPQSATLAAPSFTPPPDDPLYSDQWSLNNTEQQSGMTPGVDIGAPAAWGVTTGSSSVIIAVVDSGVDWSQEDLSGKFVDGYDAPSGLSGPLEGGPCTAPPGCPNSDDALGTAMAGLAAADTNNGKGIAGVCPDCLIMPVRIGYSDPTNGWTSYDTWAVNGINYAVSHGASVIVSSWHWALDSGPVDAAIANAAGNSPTSGRGGLGTVVVFASGDNNSSSVNYPANLSTTISGVIAVGALNMCNARKQPLNEFCNNYETWWGSNFGTQLDLVAPGINLDITDRTGTAGYNNGCSLTPGNYNICFRGTAGSAAIVSGVAGLLLSVKSGLSAADVRTILESTAVDVPPAGFDNDTGYGVVNANNAVRAATNVYIGGTFKGSYYIPSGGQKSPNYPGTFAGPVHVVSTSGKIMASERQIYGSSFAEAMGIPGNQLTTDYWFSWYDGVYMHTWISIGAPDTNSANALVDVYIGTTKMNTTSYSIAPGANLSPDFPGSFNGPVHVVSTNGQKIIVSERQIYGASFAEAMGIPGNSLTTDYWFSWYDGVYMRSWVSIGAPTTNTGDALVDVYIGTTKMNSTPYDIPPGGQQSPYYPGQFAGPVHVVSTNGQKIIATERQIYGASFAESMGVPTSQLTTDYWSSWYDGVYMRSWVSIGAPTTNVGSALVDIYIGGTKMNTVSYSIAPGANLSPAFPGTFAGPVHVVSTNGKNLIVTERQIYGASFAESMGVPNNQLTTDYWFPWYDGVYMRSWVSIGAP